MALGFTMVMVVVATTTVVIPERLEFEKFGADLLLGKGWRMGQ